MNGTVLKKAFNTYKANLRHPEQWKIVGECVKAARQSKKISIKKLVATGIDTDKIKAFEAGSWPSDDIGGYQQFMLDYPYSIDSLVKQAKLEKQALANEYEDYDDEINF